MNKLFNLKEWLTLKDSAKHLSLLFDEEVLVADILRLALSNKLKISVNFVNHAIAMPWKIVPIEEATLITHNLKGEKHGIPLDSGYQYDDKHVIEPVVDAVYSINGVWDLSMLGSERLDIEHLYQQLTGGPDVTLINIDGTFVEQENGAINQIMEEYGEDILEEFEAQFKVIGKSNKKTGSWSDKFYPANCLPDDAVIVVRTAELRRLEESLGGKKQKLIKDDNDSPAPQSKIYELLKALVHLNYGEDILSDLKSDKSMRLSEIKTDLENKGYFYDSKTLREHLKNLPD